MHRPQIRQCPIVLAQNPNRRDTESESSWHGIAVAQNPNPSESDRTGWRHRPLRQHGESLVRDGMCKIYGGSEQKTNMQRTLVARIFPDLCQAMAEEVR